MHTEINLASEGGLVQNILGTKIDKIGIVLSILKVGRTRLPFYVVYTDTGDIEQWLYIFTNIICCLKDRTQCVNQDDKPSSTETASQPYAATIDTFSLKHLYTK